MMQLHIHTDHASTRARTMTATTAPQRTRTRVLGPYPTALRGLRAAPARQPAPTLFSYRHRHSTRHQTSKTAPMRHRRRQRSLVRLPIHDTPDDAANPALEAVLVHDAALVEELRVRPFLRRAALAKECLPAGCGAYVGEAECVPGW